MEGEAGPSWGDALMLRGTTLERESSCLLGCSAAAGGGCAQGQFPAWILCSFPVSKPYSTKDVSPNLHFVMSPIGVSRTLPGQQDLCSGAALESPPLS